MYNNTEIIGTREAFLSLLLLIQRQGIKRLCNVFSWITVHISLVPCALCQQKLMFAIFALHLGPGLN